MFKSKLFIHKLIAWLIVPMIISIRFVPEELQMRMYLVYFIIQSINAIIYLIRRKRIQSHEVNS